MRAIRLITWLALLSGSLQPAIALAQATLPGSVQPGQIERRFQPTPPPRSTLAPVVPPIPERRLAPAEAEKIHFSLSALQVTGSTVYRPADFLPLYQADLGRQISVAELYRIADAITAKYRNDGYILSRAYVPPQKIAGGVVHIVVIEGYVDKVRYEGDTPKGRPDLFQYYVAQITGSRPLRLSVLERYLLLAGDLAGTNVRSVFEPSPHQTGAATLVVILTEKPVEGQLGLDNRGTKSLGPLELNVGGAVNNALGLYERTAINVVLTPQRLSDLQYYHVQHEETLDGEGTKLTAEFTYIRTNPGDILTALDVQGRDTAAALTLSHPFIRSREQNLFGGITFTYRDVTTDELGLLTANDRLRILTGNVSYDFSDAWRGITQVTGALSRGLGFLGATADNNPLASRLGGKTDFTRVSLQASRTQELFGGWSLLGQLAGQYSPDSLLASEQFAFGGEPFGRAYDPAELTGDSGIAESVELRYEPDIPVAYLRTAQLFTYYDAGQLFNRLHPTFPGTLTASSAGLGVRLTPKPYLFASIEGDKPLTRNVAADGNKDWRVFFRIVARY